MDEIVTADKSVEDAVTHSIQSVPATDGIAGGGLLGYLVQAGTLIAPWWSRRRDIDLDRFWKQSDHLSGAKAALTAKVASVPVRVLPRDTAMKTHWKQAEVYNIRLVEESEFGQSWISTVSKFLEDYWLSDLGGHLEIIGDGDPDGPIAGPALGVAHLDSHRCQHTGSAEYPIIYQDLGGQRYKLHRTRVAFAADSPSARAEMFGTGFCALSRAINSAQSLIDIGTYKQEKLGSRPLRAALIGKGIRTEAITDSLKIAAETMDNQGLSRFSKMPVIGNLSPQASLEIVDFASLPDGFDEDTSTKLGMFAIALAFGVPIRWIWPAASVGATKADAEFQHIAGLGGGIGKALATLTMMLGGDPRGPSHMKGKFLPSHLKLVFDFQDDEQDRTRAQIRNLRAMGRNQNINSAVYSVRVAREYALEDGDLSRSQFAALELEDGRLPDGSDVLSLFNVTDPVLMRMLDMGVDEPLAVNVNDPLDMLMEIESAALSAMEEQAAARSLAQREKATQALMALNALKDLYIPFAVETPEVMEAVDEQIEQGQPGQPSPAPTEVTPEGSVSLEDQGQPLGELPGPTPTMLEGQKSYGEKQEEDRRTGFNWGAPVGEIIRGQLARGAGGRFINADEMRLQILRGLIGRLRGRRGESGVSTAASRRIANRAKVAKLIGVPEDLVQDLADLRSGEGDVDADALITRNLAQRNPDGSITMTPSGRSLLSAANSGDVDRAKTALLNAKKEPKGRGKTSAQRRSERKRADTIKALKGQLPDIEAFMRFADGGNLSDAEARTLSHAGLIEFDRNGQPRMTGDGNSFASAVNSGNTRKAKDALSKASDRVQEYRDAANTMRERSATLKRQLRDIRIKLTALQSQLVELSDDIEGNAPSIVNVKKEIDNLRQLEVDTNEAYQYALGIVGELEDEFGT